MGLQPIVNTCFFSSQWVQLIVLVLSRFRLRPSGYAETSPSSLCELRRDKCDGARNRDRKKRITNHHPKKISKKIFEKMNNLTQNPRPEGSEKPTGQDRYRLRQGRYRILYPLQDDKLTVWVVKVAHRKDIYTH